MSEVHVLATITPAPGKEARVCTSTFAPHQLYARRLTFLTAQGTPHWTLQERRGERKGCRMSPFKLLTTRSTHTNISHWQAKYQLFEYNADGKTLIFVEEICRCSIPRMLQMRDWYVWRQDTSYAWRPFQDGVFPGSGQEVWGGGIGGCPVGYQAHQAFCRIRFEIDGLLRR